MINIMFATIGMTATFIIAGYYAYKYMAEEKKN